MGAPKKNFIGTVFRDKSRIRVAMDVKKYPGVVNLEVGDTVLTLGELLSVALKAKELIADGHASLSYHIGSGEYQVSYLDQGMKKNCTFSRYLCVVKSKMEEEEKRVKEANVEYTVTFTAA